MAGVAEADGITVTANYARDTDKNRGKAQADASLVILRGFFGPRAEALDSKYLRHPANGKWLISTRMSGMRI